MMNYGVANWGLQFVRRASQSLRHASRFGKGKLWVWKFVGGCRHKELVMRKCVVGL